MSFITPGTVQAIAHSLDIPQLSDDAAKALAPDVEYRLREVIQEALKFAKHSKRLKVTTEDINNALRLRNAEPLYGFGSRDPARFVRASGHPDLFFLADPERPFSQARATAACQRRTWNCSRMGGS
ncbi:Transcription initiation factor TFIID subunit 6 [Monoraphidium neglectum]|uniref:Transcription initiation factor TFIID subunit 6 n=1 Tax=Monoraphidium neglectum TaxID=145388 RepID=A0A0D2LUF8_9CHLO|nr:Transcription initiation factor TFIID subunit 6 [Monoraphidium neglectum]KIY93241.1 Transcription initiation factor TFIID subunit 6 [Monoraphidium neglectum]|eukprot:XP_013892261.1 Transcription initiation factor TFIID subunit 6 [Monoraphidium neglectum]